MENHLNRGTVSLISLTSDLTGLSPLNQEQKMENFKTLRDQTYLPIFNESIKYNRDESWTRNQFEQMALKFIESTPFEKANNPSSKRYFLSRVMDSTTVSKDAKLISYGRSNWNDVVFPPILQNCSRLQFIIIVLPKHQYDGFDGIWMVVDPGSLFGIKTIERSSGKQLVNCTPSDRNLLIFGMDEQVTLRCPAGDITICFREDEPKDCIICNEAIREVVIRPCNHFIACENCIRQWLSDHDQCPICNDKVNKDTMELQLGRNATMMF